MSVCWWWLVAVVNVPFFSLSRSLLLKPYGNTNKKVCPYSRYLSGILVFFIIKIMYLYLFKKYFFLMFVFTFCVFYAFSNSSYRTKNRVIKRKKMPLFGSYLHGSNGTFCWKNIFPGVCFHIFWFICSFKFLFLLAGWKYVRKKKKRKKANKGSFLLAVFPRIKYRLRTLRIIRLK